MTQLRVALYTEIFLPKLDGIVRILCLTLEHLRRIGADAMVFVPGDRVESYVGYPVVSIPGIPFPLYPEVTMAIPGRREYDMLAEFNPSVVHVLNPAISGVRAMHFARKIDKPLIASFHANVMEGAEFYGVGFLVPLLWRYHRYLYNRADVTVATSKHMVQELENHGFNNVGLWRRGVSVERFSPEFGTQAMRDRISGGNSDKVILLYVGRLAAEKQVDQIRHALDAVPNTHLALVGDGPYRAKLEEILSGYPVTFTGYMDGDELSSAYASADIFVFPSSMFETFGLVAAEAMASGLPIVSSRVGGIPELVRHGQNSFMFDVNNTDQMVEYVRQLVEDPEKRVAMGQRAREDMKAFSWESIMDEFFQVYHDAIDNHARQNGRIKDLAAGL